MSVGRFNAPPLYSPERKCTHRKMFPDQNVHYLKHYDIGYTRARFPTTSEYNYRFATASNCRQPQAAKVTSESSSSVQNISYDSPYNPVPENQKKKEPKMFQSIKADKPIPEYKPTIMQKSQEEIKLPQPIRASSLTPRRSVPDYPIHDVWDAITLNRMREYDQRENQEKEEKQFQINAYKSELECQMKLKKKKLIEEKNAKERERNIVEKRNVDLEQLEMENEAKKREMRWFTKKHYEDQISEKLQRYGIENSADIEETDPFFLRDENRKNYLTKIEAANRRQEMIYRQCASKLLPKTTLLQNVSKSINDQQIAEKQFRNNSVLLSKKRDRELMQARIEKIKEEERQLQQDKRHKQEEYRDILNFQRRERDKLLEEKQKALKMLLEKRPKPFENFHKKRQELTFDLRVGRKPPLNSSFQIDTNLLKDPRIKEAAEKMEAAVDTRKINPILNPVPHSDNPYLLSALCPIPGRVGSEGLLREAGRHILSH